MPVLIPKSESLSEALISTPALAENVAERARTSLSYYCMFECKALCCRKGFLTLNEEDTKKIVDKLPVKNITGDYNIDISNGCPKIKDNKCTIYKVRPKICRDYPVFVRHFAVHLSEKCPAVRENKLYEYEHEFVRMGIRVIRV